MHCLANITQALAYPKFVPVAKTRGNTAAGSRDQPSVTALLNPRHTSPRDKGGMQTVTHHRAQRVTRRGSGAHSLALEPSSPPQPSLSPASSFLLLISPTPASAALRPLRPRISRLSPPCAIGLSRTIRLARRRHCFLPCPNQRSQVRPLRLAVGLLQQMHSAKPVLLTRMRR